MKEIKRQIRMNNEPHSYLSFSVYYIYNQRWISIKITIYKLGGKSNEQNR